MEKRLKQAGFKFDSVVEVLNNLVNDKPDEITNIIKTALNQRQSEPYLNIGFVGSADIEVTGHATYGQLVTYETQLNQSFGSLFYSTVKAFTNNNPITHGTMVSASKNPNA